MITVTTLYYELYYCCLSLSLSVICSELKFSTGKIARLADGSVIVRAGGSAVLVTAVSKGFGDDAFTAAPLKVCGFLP